MIGVAGLLAGCGDDPRSAPTPTPTYSCTPDPTGAPCTAELAAAQAEEAKAYEEAIFAYQQFTKERNRLLHAGGTATATAELERFGTGLYLEAMVGDLRTVYEKGWSTTGDVVVRDFGRHHFESNRLEFFLCEDATAVRLIGSEGEQLTPGRKGRLRVTATGEAGERRIADTTVVEDWEC